MKAWKTLAVAMGMIWPSVIAEEEWQSPHPLVSMEAITPASLLPYPKVWNPARGTECDLYVYTPLPGRDEWTLEGDRTDGAMVQTAWQGLLQQLPQANTGRRVVCHLVLDGEAMLAEGHRAYDAMHAHELEERMAEGYVMHTSPERVQITAATEAGLFYGLQTLRQLTAGAGGRAGLRTGVIVDYPAFAVRGFHQDCGRNFQSIESLKRQIDIASQLKLNYFHWHLTDFPAYHLQCKKYPQLNAPEHRTRDKADTYTYDQVRELIAYAKARHVTIIPEIDMPGHSDYFVRAFGFEMHTEQGMKVLEDIIDEFCAEIPAEDCPIFHIGADEVSVPNAYDFVLAMALKLYSHGRRIMQWEGPWDLPVGSTSIAQRWVQGKASQDATSITQPTIDSSIGYSNLMDPALLVRRWFFMQPCGVSRGDALHRGAIFCTWPDRRVADKSLIPLQSPQWPGMCAMAERAWVGGSNKAADAYPTDMPSPKSEAGRAFRKFEQRMRGLRYTLFKDEPFPYWWPQGEEESLVVGPVPMEQVEAVRAKVLAGDLMGLPVRKAYGSSLYFHMAPGAWNLGMFSHVKPGHCVWVIRQEKAAKAGLAPYMMGFDAPLRSHQYYTGIPEPGEWSRCGTRIWLNGEELRNPRRYSLSHAERADMARTPEIPLSNEEIWWTQEPAMLPLAEGENTLIIEQPYLTPIQSWSVSVYALPTWE